MKPACALCAASLFAVCAGVPAETPEPLFRPGDRWVAIGDSITHSRRYHSFVYLFQATRHPDRELGKANAGVSGDSAGGALQRFDWDIAPHRPTVATVMLGMNDVGRGLYAPGQAGDAVEARRQQCIDAYLANMIRLTERLRDLGCRVVFITPSIYDQTGTQTVENCVGVNDALGRMGDLLREAAPGLGARVVDLHGPMTELNRRLQEKDPDATLVGPDRVHPGDVGQLVMAYLILRQTGETATVADVAIDAATGTVEAAENCRIDDLRRDGEQLTFTYHADALPFPVPPEAADALRIVPFAEELNRETFRIRGLPPGRYTLLIDGNPVLVADAEALAAGADLAANPRSPMLRQAADALALETARHAIVAGNLRTFAAQRHWLTRSRPDLDPNDFDAMKAALLADLESKKGAGNFGYFKSQADIYIRRKPEEADLVRRAAELDAEMRRRCRPVRRVVEIRPAVPADEAALARAPEPDFLEPDGWQPTSWTAVKQTVTLDRGVLRVSAARSPGVRDMAGLQRSFRVELGGGRDLVIRYRADRGAHVGVEVRVDSNLVRLANYLPATGEAQELRLPVRGEACTALTLILAEPNAECAWDAPSASYAFESIRFE